jgi:hypothetical protein
MGQLVWLPAPHPSISSLHLLVVLLAIWIESVHCVLVTNYTAGTLPVSVSHSRVAYVIEKFVSMRFHVPIMELESAVDSISNTMYSLKSVQKIEFYDPYNTVIEGANYTFFKKKLPLYRASRLCNKMGANPLTLANLPQNTTLSGPLLLQFELSYGGRLYCVGPDRGFVDDD